MKKVLAAFAFALAPPACANAQNPVSWSLESPSTVTTLPAGLVRVRLKARIENGWRVYSLNQKPGGPYAMRITLLPGSPSTIIGPIVSPPAAAKYDSSFRMMTETYSGAQTFSLTLQSPKDPGTTSSTIKIRYQACNARFCLPPRNALLATTSKVKLSL